MNQKTDKGFTLIELLVVIAIIGILASVVLASLNSARAKGKDAAIKAQLSSMRAEMALYADGNPNGYTGGCIDISPTVPNPGKLYVASQAQVPNTNPSDCQANATDWAAYVTLNIGGGYCVDSTGYVGPGSSSGATVCTPNTP